MAWMSRSRPPPSISSAMPTRCSAPSPRARRSRAPSRSRMRISASALDPRMLISACAAYAPWASGSRATSNRRSSSRAGSKRVPRSPAYCIRPSPQIPAMLYGDATSPAPLACSPFILKPAPHAALAAMLDGLSLFGMGYSWGGFESLILPFDPRDYRTATTWAGRGPGASPACRPRGRRGSEGRSRGRLRAARRSPLAAAKGD